MNPPSKPMITTIIPTRRRPKLLQRAIKSALNQTYPHLQVCVYDNASNDETASVVAEIAKTDSRVKYHCHEKNIGVDPNFQYGLEHVNTPFFSFLSDDDILLPNFYQMAIEGFDNFPDAMFSAGITIFMNNKGRVMNGYLSTHDLSLWKREGYYTPPESLFAILKGGNPIWTAILFRKEVIEKVGLLDMNVGTAGDLDFELRIAARFPIVVRKEPYAIFRIHDLTPGSVVLKSVWPGRLKLVHNISKDERIPLDVRLSAEKLMIAGLISNLFNMGFFFIKRKNFEDAYEIADILSKQYNQKAKAMVVYTAAKIVQYLPMGDKVYDSLAKIRRFLMQYESEALQKQYGSYDQYLQK